MLGNRKLIVDNHSEVYKELLPWIDDEFWDLDQHDVVPGAIYIFCREQVNKHNQRIQDLARNDVVTVIIDNAAEGSETLVTWCYIKGLVKLIEQKKICLITGGHLPASWPHIYHEYFLPKVFDFDENIQAAQVAKAIFKKTHKPYKFLFLNGRARVHRKYLIERFNLNGLLNSALWTNLDRGLKLVRQPNSGYLFSDQDPAKTDIQLFDQDQNLMLAPRDVHYLPRQYEVDRYQDRVDLPIPDKAVFLDDHLFAGEWGEIYINPDPYIDTYFSVVTETVFNYPYTFRTEKIWKPIAMGHPFVAVSNCGYLASLRNLGFQTFGHVIDESFDQIDHSQDRIERIAQVIEDLCRQDLASFLKECYNVCKYNQQHYVELRTQVPSQFSDRFLKFFNQQHNANE